MNNSPSYRRVSTSDDIGSGSISNSHPNPRHSFSTNVPRRTLSERIADKIVAALWVSVAVLIAYWSNFFYVILNPAESGANQVLIRLAAIGCGINTVLLLYLIIYLPYFLKLNDSSAWEVYCPSTIPIMTFIGLTTGFLLVRGTWPVWGFLSPLILGIEAFGFLYLLHFAPAPSF